MYKFQTSRGPDRDAEGKGNGEGCAPPKLTRESSGVAENEIGIF